VKKATTPKERPVIVCTEHRGVFFGYSSCKSGDEIVHLKKARMAIYFGTTKGVMQLAETGPTSSSKISARADLELRKVTCVMEVTKAAAAKWEAA
jgi:hypothetical protein